MRESEARQASARKQASGYLADDAVGVSDEQQVERLCTTQHARVGSESRREERMIIKQGTSRFRVEARGAAGQEDRL